MNRNDGIVFTPEQDNYLCKLQEIVCPSVTTHLNFFSIRLSHDISLVCVATIKMEMARHEYNRF
jgi:hypothetical protein